MSLGELIRGRRKQAELTLAVVAQRVGISKPYLSNIETDKLKNPPSDPVLAGLEQELGFAQGELARVAHLARTPADVRQEHENLSAEVEKLRGMIDRFLAGEAQTSGSARELGQASGALSSAREASGGGGGNISPAITAGRAIPIINSVAAGYPYHFTDLDYPPSVADEYVRCPDVHDPQAFAARVVGDSMAPKYNEGDLVIFAPNAAPRNGDDCFVRFADDESTTFKRFCLRPDGKVRLEPLNDSYPIEVYDREDITGLWPAVMRVERLRKP